MNGRPATWLLLVTLAGCGQAPEPSRPIPDGPNVLLISIDTLRADHVGAYGYTRPTTPHLDRLATEGVLFEQHISSTSWTLPAHAALFTSLPDTVHGCTDTDRVLADGHTTLAERFFAVGYDTGGFFAGPYLHPAFGLGQGFDHYENCTSYARRLDDTPVEQWAMAGDVMQQSHRDVTNPTVLDAFERWLSTHDEGRPFFAFVHLWDVHFDFVPPPPYDTMFDPDYDGPVTGDDFFFDERIHAGMDPRDLEHLVALYDGEIAWTDAHVGRIIERLAATGVLDDTVIAVTSDHGTAFFEHGMKGHRMSLHEELIRVPLIVRYPPGLPAGVRVPHQTRAIDVGPTLMELAGLPASQRVMGHSLAGLVDAATPGFDNAAVSELFSVGHAQRTLRTETWKLYHLQETSPGEVFLFTDLRADPGEHAVRPLGDAALAERYEGVTEAMRRHRASLDLALEEPEIPPEVLRQLRSLGYVGE